MAIPVNANDLILVTLVQALSGQTLMNTFKYKVNSRTPAMADYSTFAPALFAKLNGIGQNAHIFELMRQVQSNEVTHTRCWIQTIYPQPYRKYQTFIGLLGQSANAASFTNTAATITKFSDLAKRYGRSSNHVGGIPKNNCTIGLWDTPTLNKLDQLAGVLVANITLGVDDCSLSPVVFNVRSPQVNPLLLTEAQAQTTTRTMRRRTVGLGI